MPERSDGNKKTVSVSGLDEVIRRIVDVADPDKVILFGSAARGEAGPDSDLDLLVVKSGEFHRGRLVESIYMNLIGVGQAVDVVIVTPEEVEQYRNSHALVIAPALKEGQIVYDASESISTG